MSELLPSFYLELFAEKKSFRWKNQLLLFCRKVREKFWDIWKKNPEFFGKSFMRVEKTAFFVTEKNVREKRTLLWKEICFNEIIRPEQKFRFSFWTFFQQFCRKTLPVFRSKFWGFFCREFFLFLFHLTILGPSKRYFLQWC